MKVALLSDIHGNHFALEAVLKDVRDQKISTLLICGDFVGYYYNPSKVLDFLESFDVVACRGNHEDLFKEWLTGSYDRREQLNKKYGSCFERSEDTLRQEQKKWILNLEHPVSWTSHQKKICLSHGAPWDLNLYLYENTIDTYADNFKNLSGIYDVIVLGHSHYQFMKKVEELLIISPGSVGQPRSGKIIECSNGYARAQWALINLQNMVVDLKTTFYNASFLCDEINIYDPSNDYLKSVLQRQ